MEGNKIKNCFNCQHLDVCEFSASIVEKQKKFIDFDKPNGGEFLNRFFELVAERCRYFKSKLKCTRSQN